MLCRSRWSCYSGPGGDGGGCSRVVPTDMPSDAQQRYVERIAAYLSHEEIQFIWKLFNYKERLPWKSGDRPLLSMTPHDSIYLLFSYFVDCGGSLSDIALTASESDYDRYKERGIMRPSLRRYSKSL